MHASGDFVRCFRYSERFGLTWVDYATQKRTPKLSSPFYRHVIARNAT